MKAAVNRRYGPPDVVAIAEVPTPSFGDDEVLIKVHATTITAGDWRMRAAVAPAGFGPLIRLAFGLRKPRKSILGMELAGQIEAVGKDVRRFAVGDKVFAFTGASLGCHAEYKALREDAAIAPKPSTLSDGEAAALSFGGTTALFFLRDKAHIRSGEKVLIVGASGAVGSAAVQLAKHFGAVVTGVCSESSAPMVRTMGADHVIDYAKEDFTKGSETFDIILDTVGDCSFASCQAVLADRGRLLLVAADLGRLLGAVLRPSRAGKRVCVGTAPERAEDLRFLGALAEAGAYRPFIDRSYPFDRIVEAHARVETRRKKGNVVVVIANEAPSARAASSSA